jgi:isochorismate hydrolase
MSILLASLLIGVGYDAYCVYGIAPKEITSKNEALMECDFLPNLRQPDENQDVQEEFVLDEAIFLKRITHSTFDKTMVENEKRSKE